MTNPGMTDQAKGLKASIRQTSPISLDTEIECAPGEVLALIGPSGSGKSTVLRCIAGLHAPRDGRIECGGEVWFDSTQGIRLSTAQRRIGMVFQNYALFPHLSALENVLEGMDDPASALSRERAVNLMRKVNLEGLEARKPHQLSGGQQQRVAVARALAREPHVLLLDEPFSAVDRATRERLYVELADLRTSLNMPIILVTHELEEAVMLADRMTILSHGKSLQSGLPMELTQQPATVEVARLVGMRNVFDAQVVAHCHETDNTLLAWGDLQLKVRLQPDFPVGAKVAWTIPSASVLLVARNHPKSGSRDNLVECTLVKMLTLGDRIRVQVLVDGMHDALLTTTVPRHLADTYALEEGQTLSVRLRGEHIHLMPHDDLDRAR